MKIRRMIAWLVAGLLILVMMAIGCGGAQDEPQDVRNRLVLGTMSERTPSVEVPEATARNMKVCVGAQAGQLADSLHASQYDLVVNERGHVLRVKLVETTLPDGPLQACFGRALTAMSVPTNEFNLRSPRPVSGGERITTGQRGLLGSSESESPLVFFGPLIVEAGGAKVLVDIGLIVLAGVAVLAEALDEDDPEQICQDRYMDCLLTDMGGRRGHKYDHSRCQWCREACIRGNGVWPSRTEGATGKSCEYWRRGK